MARIVVVGLLLAGPWTDEREELAGWDAERFQEIADRDGAAWVDEPIEYPPGSVVVLDRLAGEDVVSTNRRLIIVSALLEAAGVALLWRTAGRATAKAFLVLGLPLVPMGLMRLDMAVTVIALAAGLLLLTRSDHRDGDRRSTGAGPSWTVVGFALLVAAGAMIKIWPALLVAGAWAIGRRVAAVAAAAATAAMGLGWLVVVGDGIDPLQQILSLRDATGWHVESVPGALTALFSDADARLELNAFRIGTLNGAVVTLGRLLALAAIWLTVVVAGRTGAGTGSVRNPGRTLGLVMLASTTALLITAPLLSPQFLLWLTPWGALLLADGTAAANRFEPAGGTAAADRLDRTDRWSAPGDEWGTVAVGLAFVAVVLTGFTLTVFGPDRLADRLPALLLTARNLALLAVPAACLASLLTDGRSGSDLVER